MSDAVAMGADRAEAERWVAAMDAGDTPQSREFEVYAENLDAALFFLRVQTQWNVGGMGGLIGLNYTGVESAMRTWRVKDRAAMMTRIQWMEFAALEAMSEETNASQ